MELRKSRETSSQLGTTGKVSGFFDRSVVDDSSVTRDADNAGDI